MEKSNKNFQRAGQTEIPRHNKCPLAHSPSALSSSLISRSPPTAYDPSTQSTIVVPSEGINCSLPRVATPIKGSILNRRHRLLYTKVLLLPRPNPKVHQRLQVPPQVPQARPRPRHRAPPPAQDPTFRRRRRRELCWGGVRDTLSGAAGEVLRVLPTIMLEEMIKLVIVAGFSLKYSFLLSDEALQANCIAQVWLHCSRGAQIKG